VSVSKHVNVVRRDSALGQAPFVVIDTETSLASIRTPDGTAFYDIVEVACISASLDKMETEQFRSLVKPYYGFNAPSCKAPHISEAALASAPTFPHVADRMLAFLRGRLLLGQNTHFDVRAVRAAAERYALDGLLRSTQYAELDDITSQPFLDTRKLFRLLYPAQKHSSLASIAGYYGVEDSSCERHAALEDARLTLLVFRRIAAILQTERRIVTVGDLFDYQNGTFGIPDQTSLF
jgi:DNA polymerase III epsilon subunit-like protein